MVPTRLHVQRSGELIYWPFKTKHRIEFMQAIGLLPAVSTCMLLKEAQDEHTVHFELPVAIIFVFTHA